MHLHRKRHHKFEGNNVFAHRIPEIVNPIHCTNLFLKCASSTRYWNFKYVGRLEKKKTRLWTNGARYSMKRSGKLN